jgi:hypothetical protein
MPAIEVLGSGWVDRRDSAFPQAVQLPGGDLLCSFSVGGGPEVYGGTDMARSVDGGETWTIETQILAPRKEPTATNFLKLTLSPDGKTIYAYGSRLYREPGEKFGTHHNDAVICISTDEGRTWSEPQLVPFAADCPMEVSHGVLACKSGRLIAPGATLRSKDQLGAQVIGAISDDGGKTWPDTAVIFEDPHRKHGYFEQKIAEYAPGKLIATAWTVTLGDVSDKPNSFAVSDDNGKTWSPPKSIGTQGQTLAPIPLGGDRLLALYNRRYGHQGIVMALATFDSDGWTIHHDDLMYDARTERQRPDDNADTGVDEFDSFAFGFPTGIVLQDGTILATHWCQEDGKFGIRWTKLRVDWP